MFNTNHKFYFNRCDFSMLQNEYERGCKDETINTEYLINLISSHASKHPHYAELAGFIALEKSILNSPLIEDYLNVFDEELSDEFKAFFSENFEQLSKEYEKIIYEFNKGKHKFDIFSVSTAKKVYNISNKQGDEENMFQTFLREAVATSFVYGIEYTLEIYNLLVNKKFTFATPTIMNGGRKKGNLSSCFLLKIPDSISGMYEFLGDAAKISQCSGGIGFSFTNVRGRGSRIGSSGGRSCGQIPHLKVYEACARAVDQGGRRKGSFAPYNEIWHIDIMDFCELRKNNGKEEMRARDLFIALYTNDLFFERVKKNQDWTLFCPNDVRELTTIYGDEFKAKYEEFEKAGLGRDKVNARKLWSHIVNCNIETGTPFMVDKDAVNKMNMQDYAGIISSSNLCTEIVEYTSDDEIAVCNLATISLPSFVQYDFKSGTKKFDFDSFAITCEKIVKCLNVVIDTNYYPVEKARKSNMRHRPIGFGIQGLADVFQLLRIPFESDEAKELNRKIAEYMQYYSYKSSMELCKYGLQDKFSDFDQSQYAKGKLHFDLCRESGYNTATFDDNPITDGELPWDFLKAQIVENGLCNSLLIALPPTASTSQLLGNNEAGEPRTYNLYLRRTLSGEYIVINKHLVNELDELGLWTPEMAKALIISKGSVQELPVPQWVKDVFKTTFEIDSKEIIIQARDRQPFVCQSQSMNLWISNPTPKNITESIFLGKHYGLKTLQYYLRRETPIDAISGLGIDANMEDLVKTLEKNLEKAKNQCSLDNPDDCLACGS